MGLTDALKAAIGDGGDMQSALQGLTGMEPDEQEQQRMTEVNRLVAMCHQRLTECDQQHVLPPEDEAQSWAESLTEAGEEIMQFETMPVLQPGEFWQTMLQLTGMVGRMQQIRQVYENLRHTDGIVTEWQPEEQGAESPEAPDDETGDEG